MVDDAGGSVGCDVCVKVAPPTPEETELLRTRLGADLVPGALDQR